MLNRDQCPQLMHLKMLEQERKCSWTVESLGITGYGGDNEGTVSISSYRWHMMREFQLQMESRDVRICDTVIHW